MIYEYQCRACGRKQEAVRTVANRNRSPRCCGSATERLISGTHHIVSLFTPYRAAGAERGRLIRNRQEHRGYLRQHGYEEVGNDPAYAPPPPDPDRDAAKAREEREAFEGLKHAPELPAADVA